MTIGDPPFQVGRYRAVELIHRGGITHDFVGEHTALGKRVTLRIAAQPSSRRMEHVARLHAQLVHPNVHDVYDVLDHGGHTCLVLKHLMGETLQERLQRDGPLDVAEALGLTRQIATALAYIHGEGIVNGGIKPKNIRVERGRAYVSKFNAARRLAGDDTVRPDVFIGTPSYCAPEQLAGFAHMQPASDVWALGVTLHELVTGEAKSLARIDDGPLPDELRELVGAMLAPDPAERCSCDEIVSWIDDILLSSTVFVALPYADAFRPVRDAIRRACQGLGIRCEISDESLTTGDIVAKIHRDIAAAGMLIVDLSPVGRGHDDRPIANPNVLYELGLAHGHHKDVVIITQDVGTLAFDIASHAAIRYDLERLDQLEAQLTETLRRVLQQRRRQVMAG